MVEAVVEFDYEAQQEDELSLRVGDIIIKVTKDDGGWWKGEIDGRRGLFPDNFVREMKKEVKRAAGPKSDLSNGSTSPVPEPDLRPARKGDQTHQRRCKASFSYVPQNEDELELKIGDVIHILGEVEEGWWQGSLNGKTGMFPSNFTRELEDTAPSLDTSTRSSQEELRSNKTSKDSPGSESDGGEIQPKKVRGFGFGDIFKDQPIRLRPASGDMDTEGEKTQVRKSPSVSLETMKAEPERMVKGRELCKVIFPYDAHNEDELSMKEGEIVTIINRDCADTGWWMGEIGGRKGVFPDNFVKLLIPDVEKERPKKPPPPSIPSGKHTTGIPPSPLSTGNPPSPLSTGNPPSPLSTGNPPSPLSTGNPPSPLSTGNPPSPLSTGNPPSPLSTGNPPSPLSTGNPPSPLSTGNPPSPLSTGNPPSPLSTGNPPSPLSTGNPPSPLSTGNPPSPLSTGNPPSPLSTGNPPSPLSTGNPPSPLSTGNPPSPLSTGNPPSPLSTGNPPSPLSTGNPPSPLSTDKRSEVRKVPPERPEHMPHRPADDNKGEEVKVGEIPKPALPSIPPKKPHPPKTSSSHLPSRGPDRPERPPSVPCESPKSEGGAVTPDPASDMSKDIDLVYLDSLFLSREKLSHPTAMRPRVLIRRPRSLIISTSSLSSIDLLDSPAVEEQRRGKDREKEELQDSLCPRTVDVSQRKALPTINVPDSKGVLPPKPAVLHPPSTQGIALRPISPSPSYAKPTSSCISPSPEPRPTPTLEELRGQLRELRASVELLKSQHRQEMKQLSSDLDEEKRSRLTMQMEVEKIKRSLFK
ncbi:SH3 domain-containing kinase-binding protein 1-like isoform X16 [Oncorhynchus keta]|uniref:SH3 domain-containing kinase-binding protein 1-like isoform X13 n=1 Tax=Oncorhynchus keta TaxID=8018 RepID=UPI00227A7379|nr:SH3 domain-containing kinase-binding protein 1-like isoform X13 [Oncorhynchus keta]XP_052358474.1 SH3 domain-containing kinase-binding protein 1-like isoform X14 [Oncorhynchus keta]XP_052358477.1 SH3 domain-containing kinase-binding protein 1-like isoform X15 [Oncorhynchus keta]XP_052358478.1 SH3 domain-containing kinase-binding protein 1-like isoform X16 [Oncorhynchus keta]